MRRCLRVGINLRGTIYLGAGGDLKAAFSRERCALGLLPQDGITTLYGACLVFRGTGHLEGPRRWAVFHSARLSPYRMAALWRDATKHCLCPALHKSCVFGHLWSVFASGSCPFLPGPRRSLT